MTSSASSPHPVRIFVAYAHKDVEYRDELVKTLTPWARLGKVEIWADNKLVSGDAWDDKIKTALYRADLILILMSRDAIASDYIHGVEMRTALEASKRGDGPRSACNYQALRVEEDGAGPLAGHSKGRIAHCRKPEL
jgi:hypothetical protein